MGKMCNKRRLPRIKSETWQHFRDGQRVLSLWRALGRSKKTQKRTMLSKPKGEGQGGSRSLCQILQESFLRYISQESNRKHCRNFNQEGTKFAELAAYKITGRAEAIDLRLCFPMNGVMFLHCGTQAVGNSAIWSVSGLSWQGEGNKDIGSTVS